MDVEIRRLTPEILNDWLYFFDSIAFCDNGEWSGCYCMCYHWNAELNRIRPWDCSREGRKLNRQCAIEMIQSGRMQGYLAYLDGKPVGWCNANSKQAYDNVHFNPAQYIPDNGEKIKCVTCFAIDPNHRGKGIATKLLQQVCADAPGDGYEMIEAYPFEHDENHAYHGPTTLYERAGFKKHDSLEGCGIYRKKV